MKIKNPLIILCTLFILLSSFKLIIDNIITKIGMKEEWVQREIVDFLLENDELNIDNSIDDIRYPAYANEYRKYSDKRAFSYMYNRGTMPYWLSEVKKYIVNNNKTETAKELCTYLKNYLESDLFANTYQKIRAERKPKAEDTPKQDAIDYFKSLNLENRIKEDETKLAALKKRGIKNEDDKLYVKIYESNIRLNKLQIQINKDLKPRQTLWNLAYPEDPAVFIKRRLEEYLDFASTVDFKATTMQKGKYLYFVNKEYELKSRQWKAIYRGGADANKVVTDFIKQWLKDGIKINSTHMDDPAPVQNTTKKSEASNTNSSSNNTNKTETTATETPAAEKPKKEKVIDKAKGLLKKKIF
jgi:hypothetical protein